MGSLTAVDLPDGRLIEYVTDGLGRRIGKKVDGVMVKQWLYRDQLKPAAELDGSGNLVAEFVFGTKANVPDYVMRGGATYRVISDQLGSPVLAVNVVNSADVPFQARYEAFGKATAVGGAALDWVPFGFAGGLYDPETGLVRFGARDYEPGTGRWTGKDPIRWQGDSPNLYAYVRGSPVEYADAEGTGPGLCVAAVAACLGVGVYEAIARAREFNECMKQLEEAQKPEPTSDPSVCDDVPPPPPDR
jgi:RHS repeat-associated protein